MANSRLDIESRRRIFAATIGVLFSILLLRLGYLQLIQHSVYYQWSEQNRIRVVSLEPPRGQIFDRNHELLVDNAPSYSLAVLPYQFLHSDSLVQRLASLIGLQPEEILRRLRRNMIGAFRPAKIQRDLDFSVLARLEERRLELPGLVIETEPKRKYLGRSRMSHLLGYLGEVNERELKSLKQYGYRLGDIVGKRGLEREYEVELRGKRGYRYVEVDALGREIRTLPEGRPQPPEPGLNLILALDDRLQAKLEELLRGKRAAGVFVNPRNGEVLALASSPDYDLNWFTGVLDAAIWDSLISDPGRPLLDRATQSAFPPGSTYKLVTAIAGLNEGIFTPQSRVTCRGALRYGRRSFACWFGKGHGTLDLYGAIEQSCNVYFYTMGLRVGVDLWAEYSRRLHFGEPTGLDIPVEKRGLVPDREYLDRRFGKGKWSEGLMLNMAIGQGDLLVTPVQMARFAMLLANRGVGYRLHAVKAMEHPLSGQIIPARVDSFRIEGVRQDVWDDVREGMYRVVNGVHGTARGSRLPDVEVAGKTGTAQNPHGKPHAWFIGFAPYENPEIAFCVFVENGGGGSVAAAPIAREVLRYYFDVVRGPSALETVDAHESKRVHL